MFKDRSDAGRQLAEKLALYRGKEAVVLALPRGGVVTGFEIARVLSLPLDIVAVRKVGAPDNPEYAIGAVGANGTVILNDAEAATIDKTWLAGEIAAQKKEAQRRSRVYRAGKKSLDITGKTAIIVDDGIATGLTMRIAVRSAKAEKVVVAVPVAPPEAVHALSEEGADEVIVLEPPEEFLGAVGAHYIRFEQVEDDEVIRLMGV